MQPKRSISHFGFLDSPAKKCSKKNAVRGLGQAQSQAESIPSNRIFIKKSCLKLFKGV
jgi:hypothetical protein